MIVKFSEWMSSGIDNSLGFTTISEKTVITQADGYRKASRDFANPHLKEPVLGRAGYPAPPVYGGAIA